MQVSTLERALLNDYQRGFPLRSNPFEALAKELSTDEITVLELFGRFHERGVISRIGPVFRPNTIGASTLAAVSVPEAEVEMVAGCISAFTEVNHNYEREHRFNLWFVVNTTTQDHREAVLSEIARKTGYEIMSLPLVRDYYINLGFDIDFGDCPLPVAETTTAERSSTDSETTSSARPVRDLVYFLQAGLPLIHAPYAEIGSRAGVSEGTVLALIENMLYSGAIKRFGVVVRHHELGYRANAMCVWDVPDDEIDALGERLAKVPFITLCYHRPRRLPQWPYNLFCMIHGKDRDTVVAQINQLVEEFDLKHFDHDVLFSGRRFKQRGAFYRLGTDSDRSDEDVAYG